MNLLVNCVDATANISLSGMVKFESSRGILDRAINKLIGSMRRVKYLTFNDIDILYKEDKAMKNTINVKFNHLSGIYLSFLS